MNSYSFTESETKNTNTKLTAFSLNSELAFSEFNDFVSTDVF